MSKRRFDAVLAAGTLGASLLGANLLASATPAPSGETRPGDHAAMFAQADPDTATAPASAPKPARRTRPQQPRKPTSEVQPDLDTSDQLAPSQMQQTMPAAVPMPGKPAKRAAVHPPAQERSPETAPSRAAERSKASLRNIACSGAFAKDSSHLKVAVAFDSKNITYTDVDSGIGGKVPATVIYPDDPKRRLEMWWNNPANRSDTYLIVINGQSNWMAPKGVHLGLGLQALEKINRKPFKLKGLNKDNVAAVSDWQGGALAVLPGGCKIGVNLTVDPKASAAIRSAVTGDKEFNSSDAPMRAAKPAVGEIIIGY